MEINSHLKAFLSTEFITQYWQEKPFFMPAALSFEAEDIDVDELAGLALEEDVESRLIKQTAPLKFSLEEGPFSEDALAKLPKENWTLLIQAVDFYLAHFTALKQAFAFIPSWRFDDVMVSISPKGGTVGPHFDQYDVFLIQAKGTREWKIGEACDEETPLAKDNTLSILQDFTPTHVHQCTTGDMLYIPPGVSHWGTASSDDCVTISIGFRAPSLLEAADKLTQDILHPEVLPESLRLTDNLKALTPSTNEQNAELSKAQLQAFQRKLSEQLLSETIVTQNLLELFTEVKYREQFDFIDSQSARELFDELITLEQTLFFRPDSRISFYTLDNALLVAINGEAVRLENNTKYLTVINALAAGEAIAYDKLSDAQLLITHAIAMDAIYTDE